MWDPAHIVRMFGREGMERLHGLMQCLDVLGLFRPKVGLLARARTEQIRRMAYQGDHER